VNLPTPDADLNGLVVRHSRIALIRRRHKSHRRRPRCAGLARPHKHFPARPRRRPVMTALNGVRNIRPVRSPPRATTYDDLSARVELVRLRGKCASQQGQCNNTKTIGFHRSLFGWCQALRRLILRLLTQPTRPATRNALDDGDTGTFRPMPFVVVQLEERSCAAECAGIRDSVARCDRSHPVGSPDLPSMLLHLLILKAAATGVSSSECPFAPNLLGANRGARGTHKERGECELERITRATKLVRAPQPVFGVGQNRRAKSPQTSPSGHGLPRIEG